MNVIIWPVKDLWNKSEHWSMASQRLWNKGEHMALCVTLDTVAIVAPGVQRLVVLCSWWMAALHLTEGLYVDDLSCFYVSLLFFFYLKLSQVAEYQQRVAKQELGDNLHIGTSHSGYILRLETLCMQHISRQLLCIHMSIKGSWTVHHIATSVCWECTMTAWILVTRCILSSPVFFFGATVSLLIFSPILGL